MLGETALRTHQGGIQCLYSFIVSLPVLLSLWMLLGVSFPLYPPLFLQGNRLIDDRELAPMKELIDKLTRGGP